MDADPADIGCHRSVRCDLYETDGTTYFSEHTFYPSAGYAWISSQDLMSRLNSMWDIRRSWFLTTSHRGWRFFYARLLQAALVACHSAEQRDGRTINSKAWVGVRIFQIFHASTPAADAVIERLGSEVESRREDPEVASGYHGFHEIFLLSRQSRWSLVPVSFEKKYICSKGQ